MLRLRGEGKSVLRAVYSFYVGSSKCGREWSVVSEYFPVKDKLRQGSVTSPWLFNVNMNGVVKEANASVLGRGLKLLRASGQLAVESISVSGRYHIGGRV